MSFYNGILIYNVPIMACCTNNITKLAILFQFGNNKRKKEKILTFKEMQKARAREIPITSIRL